MTTPFMVGAISTEVAQKVTRRLGFLLNRHPGEAALRQPQARNAWAEKAGAFSGRVTSLLGFTNMLEVVARDNGLSHLGLELAQVDSEQEQGLVRRLFTHAASVGQAMEDLIRFFPAIQTGTSVRLTREGARARFSYRIQDPSVSGSLQDAAYTLGRLCHTLRKAAGHSWALDHVTMGMPGPKSPQMYAHFFQAPVIFNEQVTALCFPASVLAAPIHTANPELYVRVCEDMKQLMPDRRDLSMWEDALREWMKKRLQNRDAISLEQAATDFGITPRTLQRRLQSLGIHFVDLRAQVRIQAASQLLSGSSLPISHISEQLGFSEISAFTRAFRSHTRQSPRAFRQALSALA